VVGESSTLAISRASVKHISREFHLTGFTNWLGTASVQFILGMLLGLGSVHIRDPIHREKTHYFWKRIANSWQFVPGNLKGGQTDTLEKSSEERIKICP